MEVVMGAASVTQQWLWEGSQPVEERDATGAVTKRFFDQGEQIAGTSYFYSKDHLGSVREMTDSTQAVVAEYAYDAWGNATKVSGSMDASFGYAGMFRMPVVGLWGTRWRIYDGTRWLSRDGFGTSSPEPMAGANRISVRSTHLYNSHMV